MSIRSRSIWLTFGIAGILSGLFVPAAFAATANGSWGNWTANTNNMTSRSVVDNSLTRASAETFSQSNLPPGYIGALGRLYVGSTFALCRQGTWVYNSATTYYVRGFTDGNYCGTSSYFSYSISRGWDSRGSGSYQTYYNSLSPNLNF